MQSNRSIKQGEVHTRAHVVLCQTLKLKDFGRKCSGSVLVSALMYAAAVANSLSGICRRLRLMPSDETVRKALLKNLPGRSELERRINAGLAFDLPKALLKKSWPVAIDLTDVPYHGQPYRRPGEVRRGLPKQGTTHFHTYATAFITQKGYRFTIAATWVQRNEPLPKVVQRLLEQVRRVGIRERFLLLDRGFYTIDVIQYLQAANAPFLMPVVHRGRRPKDLSAAKGTRRFSSWKQSGWSDHCLKDSKGRTAQVQICVSGRYYRDQKQRRRRKVLVFAYWGFEPGSPEWVREAYRKRFSIETSYRQKNQAKIRTSTRDPLRRFLYVGIALILLNVWAWIHLVRLATRRGRGIRLHLKAMPLDDMLHAISFITDVLFQCRGIFGIQVVFPTEC